MTYALSLDGVNRHFVLQTLEAMIMEGLTSMLTLKKWDPVALLAI